MMNLQHDNITIATEQESRNEINIKKYIRSNYTQGRRCVKKQKLQNCPSPSKYLHSYESVDTTLWRK